MPGTVQAEATTATNNPSLIGADSLVRMVHQFGLPLVMLGVILWWAKNDLVAPLLNAHFEVVGKIVDGQREHGEKLDAIGDKLDELIRVTK